MAEADEVKTVGNDEQTTEDPEPYLVSDSARQSGRSIESFVYQQTFDNTYQQKVDNEYKHSEMLEKIHKLGMEVGSLKEELRAKQEELDSKQQEVSTKQQEAHTNQLRDEESSKQEVPGTHMYERENPPEDLEIDIVSNSTRRSGRSIRSIDVDVHHEMASRYHYQPEGSLSDRVDRLEMEVVKLKEEMHTITQQLVDSYYSQQKRIDHLEDQVTQLREEKYGGKQEAARQEDPTQEVELGNPLEHTQGDRPNRFQRLKSWFVRSDNQKN